MTNLIDPSLLEKRVVLAKTSLVREGEVADELFFIHKGCLRAWFNNNGQEITLQFFLENDSATSLESFLNKTPSSINIEAIEPGELYVLKRRDFYRHLEEKNEFREWFYKTAINKLFTHSNRLLFLLRNKPYDRYQEFLKQNPEVLRRIPQHYIASYLGITPVSLSRIRNRKK